MSRNVLFIIRQSISNNCENENTIKEFKKENIYAICFFFSSLLLYNLFALIHAPRFFFFSFPHSQSRKLFTCFTVSDARLYIQLSRNIIFLDALLLKQTAIQKLHPQYNCTT